MLTVEDGDEVVLTVAAVDAEAVSETETVLDELTLTLVVGASLFEALDDRELDALVVTVAAGEAVVLVVAPDDEDAVSEPVKLLDALELALGDDDSLRLAVGDADGVEVRDSEPAVVGDSETDLVGLAEPEVERLAEALRESLRELLIVVLPVLDWVAIGVDVLLELREGLGVAVDETLVDGVAISESDTVTLAVTLAVMLAVVDMLAIIDGDNELELPKETVGVIVASRLGEAEGLRLRLGDMVELRLRLGDTVALGEAEPRNREMERSRLLAASVA